MQKMVILLLGLIGLSPVLAQEPPTAPVSPGAPVGCVLIQNISRTNVVDARTIDFIMKGGQVFRNNLPNSCPQLGFERAFSYVTSQTQLCSVDVITVFIQGNPTLRGATCGLGKFTPINPQTQK